MTRHPIRLALALFTLGIAAPLAAEDETGWIDWAHDGRGAMAAMAMTIAAHHPRQSVPKGVERWAIGAVMIVKCGPAPSTARVAISREFQLWVLPPGITQDPRKTIVDPMRCDVAGAV